MKIRFKSIFFFYGLFCGVNLFAQSEGEKLFKQICVACHTINQGRLVGPDLADVHLRRSEAWIIKFVQKSQSVINAGDPVAAALFEEYNKIPMPDNNYSDNQIRAIISYIAENSPGGPGASKSGVISPLSDAAEKEKPRGNSRFGEELFEGNKRLNNSGPSCNSCHHVKNDNVIAGATLAKDLTDVHTRLKSVGIQAILAYPPFPAMQQAYKDKPLTEEEIAHLSVFFQVVDENKETQQEKDYGLQLFASGFGGAFVLLILFGGLWTRRKKSSVNQKIYERQIKSI